MEHIIGILFYNIFIELPGSNQTFGEKQGTFNSPGHVKQGEKTYYRMRSQGGLEKVYGEIKRKLRYCFKSHHTKDIFALFALE